jgi:hypothetical protein
MVNIFFNVYSWLAGLISTDGCITKAYKGCWAYVGTTEKAWAERIAKTLALAGIKTTIGGPYMSGFHGKSTAYVVYIRGIRQIIQEFAKPEYEQFFSPSKWERVQKHSAYYATRARNYRRI